MITHVCLTALFMHQFASASTSTQATTVYDGVTQDKYVQYLKLDGTNGATIPIPDGSSLNANLEYTFMIWFKPMSDSWGTRLQYAFRFPASFECYFSSPQSLICESSEQCDKLITSTSGVYQNQWAHITVSGHPSFGSYLQVESHTDVLSSDTKSYVIFKQTAWGWNACVGNCNSQYGFIGGLREFIYLDQYTTPYTAQRIKNHYLTWDSSIRAYYRFSSSKYFNKDQFRPLYASVDSSVSQSIDYISNDICYPPSWTKDQFMAFTQDGLIKTTTFDGRWTPKNKAYEYTASMWIKISPDSCTQSNPATAKSSCFIFKLDEVMMLYLDKRGSAKFYFFALQNYYESQSNSFAVPENSWINIQIVFSQYGGYEIRQYDMLGRMTYYSSLVQDMQEQRSSKQFDLFTNFRGHVKNFVLFSEKRTLPLALPDQNAKINNNNCLAYFIFQPSFISGTTLSGQAVNTNNGYFNMALSSNPTYEYQSWKSYPYNSGATEGLVTYPVNLFDGIACNDNFSTLQLNSKSSYVQAQTAPISPWMNAATVEFWFRPVNIASQADYLFSLWGQSALHEFFSINLDANKILTCSPFGQDSTRSPFIQYLDFTETNRQIYRWFHITCQYEYQKEATGYLFNAPLDQKYVTSLAAAPSYMPADTYKVIIGNTNDRNRGTPLLYMKELRLWAYKRQYQDIQDWRYRQLDPKSLAVSSKLLAYVRLTEGGYNEYNFANAANSSIPQDASFNDISYTSNQEITICPQQTYYMNSLCYLNPVKLAVPAVFPDYDDTTSTLYWVITANHSSLVNASYFPYIQMQWQSTDPILNSFIQNATNKYDLRIPAASLRDESSYSLLLNITNQARTFIEQQTINFVPISCKYYTVTGGNALSFYNDYKFSQASNDITFDLAYNEKLNYCNSISFFNTLQPSITYVISPPPSQPPTLTFVFNSDNSITVTIPKAEQSKFATKTDIKILFQIYWTNSQYKSLLTPSQYHFQDILYTLNFNYEQQTVVANLKANQQSVLRNEALVLNASDTYITGFNNGNQGTLQYNWICDQSLNTLCSGQSNAILTIQYVDFKAASGQNNKTYQFQVQVVWTQFDGTIQRFYSSQNVIWYDVESPAFILAQPSPVRSTADSQFKITLANYDLTNITALNITWSIVPNLTLPSYYNLTQSNTLLTVPKGGFSTMTKYAVTILVQNKMYPIATRSQSISFMTQQPPFGGSAAITPTTGYLNSTNFQISISNWQSLNRPIQYRVWSTTTYLGNDLKDLLTTSWLNEADTFTFQSATTNPFQVEISDASQESAYFKLSPTISAQTTNMLQMLTNAVQVEDDYSLKYTYLSAIVNTFQSIEQSNTTTDDQQHQQQTSYIQTMIDSITKDISNINNTKSIDNGDSFTVIQNSVSMLSQMLQDSSYINDQIIESSLQILDNVQETKAVFQQLISGSQDFLQSYALAVSYIFKYSDKMAYSVFNNRRLADSTSQKGILEINSRIKGQKDQLMGYICNNTQPNTQIQEISTQAFDIQVQKFSLDTFTQNSSYLYSDNSKNALNVNIASLVNQAITQKVLSDPSSFCLMTTHYKLNLKPLTKDIKSYLSQYASSFLEFQITDQTGQKVLNELNLKGASDIQFSIDPMTYKNNQTICMAFSSSSENWSDKPCQTIVDTKGLFVSCQCNMIDNSLYTLFTDTSRVQGESIFASYQSSNYDKILEQYMADTSLSYLGTILILLGLGLGLTAASLILDKKDMKVISKSLESTQKFELLKQVAATSNQPLGLWIYKQEQVFAYSIPNKSNFSHMLNQMHPIFNILSKFDIYESRLSRFSLYFLQVSIYALFCICFFGSKYRNDDLTRNDTVIDDADIGKIFGIGICGIIVLLPIPYSNVLFKSIIKEKECERVNNNHSVSVNPNYHNEQTQEQNILHNSPNQIVRRDGQEETEAKQFKKAIEDLIIIPKRKYLRIGITSAAYIVAIVAIIVAISMNSQLALSNQYCTIATFYIGIFGNLFISNVLKIVLNSLYAEKLLDNEKSLLRFVLSSDAVQILKDKRYVKLAEKQQQFKPHELPALSDQSIHKTEQEGVDEPVHMEDIDMHSNLDINNHNQSQEDDIASISQNNEQIPSSVNKYMSSASPKRKNNYRIKSEEDHMRKSIDIFERAKNSSEKIHSDVRYSCVTETNKSLKRP